MKVKAVEKYYDLTLARHVLEGEEVEMTEERALELSGEDNAAGRPLVTVLENQKPGKPSGRRRGRGTNGQKGTAAGTG